MFIIVMPEISSFCQITTAEGTQTLTESLAGFVKNANSHYSSGDLRTKAKQRLQAETVLLDLLITGSLLQSF